MRNKKWLLVSSISLMLVVVMVLTGCATATPPPDPVTPITPLYVTKDAFEAALQRITNLENRGTADLSGYVKQSDLPDPPNLSGYATTSITSGLDTRLDTLEQAQSTTPKYAMVTAVRKKSADVTIYGSGMFSIAVTFYGTELQSGKVLVDDEDIAEIAKEYLFGQSLLATADLVPWTVSGGPLLVSGGTFNSDLPTAPIPTPSGWAPPNPHIHPVLVTGMTATLDAVHPLTVAGKLYTLAATGTMLIIIITPDTGWTNGQVLKLDITDLAGIEYASAAIVTEE